MWRCFFLMRCRGLYRTVFCPNQSVRRDNFVLQDTKCSLYSYTPCYTHYLISYVSVTCLSQALTLKIHSHQTPWYHQCIEMFGERILFAQRKLSRSGFLIDLGSAAMPPTLAQLSFSKETLKLRILSRRCGTSIYYVLTILGPTCSDRFGI